MAESTNGPSMEQYIETRFNLLNVAIDKEAGRVGDNLEARHVFTLKAIDDARLVSEKCFTMMLEKFKHHEQITLLLKEANQQSRDKAEEAQAAINYAANEWRNAMNDYRRDTITRVEHERLEKDFAAYKLEIAQTIAARQIRETAIHTGSTERRNESRSSITAIIGWAVGAVALVSFMFNANWPSRQAEVRSPQQAEKRVDDIIERLNAMSARINALPK